MAPADEARTEPIGARLRRLRLERGLSQRELSAPGVSYAYISRIEAGSRQPSVKALRKLAAKLAVSPEYLETGEPVRAADRREMQLADAELELRLADDPAAAVRKLRALLDDAAAAADVENALRARIALGSAAIEAGRPAEAVELLEAALSEGAVAPSARPEVYAQLGHAYAATGNLPRAIELYTRCLQEVEETDPENVVARAQLATHLGHALADAGEAERAQEVLDRVVDATGALADPSAQVKLYWSLARDAGTRGELASALANARRALALLEATENAAHVGRAHVLSGVLQLAQGDADGAGRMFDRAEELLGARPDPADLATLRTEQARRDLLLGDGAAAEERARQALALLENGDAGERGRATQALAEALALAGEVDAAAGEFDRAVSLLEEARRFPEAAQACRAWGRVLRDAGREGDALDVLDRAAELAGRRENVHVSSDA